MRPGGSLAGETLPANRGCPSWVWDRKGQPKLPLATLKLHGFDPLKGTYPILSGTWRRLVPNSWIYGLISGL